MYYLVGYTTEDNKYKLEMVTAEDALMAMCKTIPGYKSLVDRVMATIGNIDLEVINYNLDSIGITSCNYKEFSGDLLQFKEKTQVVSLAFQDVLEIAIVHENTRVDALVRTMYDLGYGYNTTDIGYEIDVSDLTSVMNYVTRTSGVGVLDVGTLKSIVRKSISNA